MVYTDHNVPFDVYTESIDYQRGVCIVKKGRPVANYSQKLNPTQKNALRWIKNF